MITLCHMGVPMGMQYSITAIGSLVIQTAINGFGAMAVAGVTAAMKISMFITCPIEAIGATMAPYAGQNLGAGKIDRIGKGLRDASLCGFAISAGLLAVVIIWGKNLAGIFLDNPTPEILAYSYQFLVTAASAYCLLVLVNAVRFSIQGMGFSVWVCGNVTLDGSHATVYLTNPESNRVWMKLRIMDADGNILGETGLIKPGEYVQSVALSEVPAIGTAIQMKIMTYEPETYYSAGAVTMNTVIGG